MKKKTTLLIMRVSVLVFGLLMAAGGSLIAHPGVGQNLTEVKVSVDVKAEPLFRTLERISKVSRIDFTYNYNELKKIRSSASSFKNASIEAILDKVLAFTVFDYKEAGNSIMIYRKSAETLAKERIAAVAKEMVVIQVKGKVVDEKGVPLPGVSVLIKGTTKGTATDAEGNFQLTVSSEKDVLVFQMIGFTKREVAIGNNTTFSITLKEDQSKLKEVVVIGYQEVSKKKVTAAVSSVRAKDIENLPSPSFDKLLQGRVAGLNVQSFSGEPGTRPTFVVRGNTSIGRSINAASALSSPLFIIDGVAFNNDDIASFGDLTGTNFIAGINPNDIESIDVLKDAAAASIYGSRGANGVVLVKTKRGKSGEAQISFNAYTGVSTQPKLSQYITGASERRYKLDYLDKYASYSDKANYPLVLTDSLNPWFNNARDWQGLFYQTGVIQNYDVSATGGTEKMNYRFSGNIYDEGGIIKSTGYKRYSLSAAFGSQLSNKLKIDGMFRFSRGDRSRGRGQKPWENPLPVDAGTFPTSLVYLSDLDIQNYTGQYDLAKDKNINDDITASITMDYDFAKNFHFQTIGSLQTSKASRDIFKPSSLSSNDQFYSQSSQSTFQNYNIDNVLSYSTKIGNNHNLNVLAGNTVNYISNGYTGLGGYGYGNNVISSVQNIDPSMYVFRDPYYGSLITGSSHSAAGLVSFFGRVNYDFKDRYLFSASLRGDASSRFGKNYRWGYFPAVSAGWIVSDEPFMKDTQNWLTMFKVRGSYGVTGNLPTSFYAPFNSYLTGQGGYDGAAASTTTYNGVNAITYDPKSLTQDNLTWERSLQTNIGFDADLFNSRLNLSVDAYNRGTSDIFFPLVMPTTSGYGNVYTNSVGVRNLGMEFNISGRVFTPGKAFQWSPRLVMAFNKNQITSLPDDNRDIMVSDYAGTTHILTKGRPIYEFFNIQSAGVYSTKDAIPFDPRTGKYITYWNGQVDAKAGSYRWIDQNGDYDVWDWFDRARVGDPNPRITGGLSNTFSYKNFALEVYTTFVLGRDVQNVYMANLLNNYKQLGSLFNTGQINLGQYSIWHQSGDNAQYADINPYGNYYYQFLNFSSAYQENGSYAKIKYINLSYNVPASFLQKIKMKQLQVYTIIDNVYSFQKSSLADVEAVDELGNYTGNGYPVPRKFTFGVKAMF